VKRPNGFGRPAGTPTGTRYPPKGTGRARRPTSGVTVAAGHRARVGRGPHRGPRGGPLRHPPGTAASGRRAAAPFGGGPWPVSATTVCLTAGPVAGGRHSPTARPPRRTTGANVAHPWPARRGGRPEPLSLLSLEAMVGLGVPCGAASCSTGCGRGNAMGARAGPRRIAGRDGPPGETGGGSNFLLTDGHSIRRYTVLRRTPLCCNPRGGARRRAIRLGHGRVGSRPTTSPCWTEVSQNRATMPDRHEPRGSAASGRSPPPDRPRRHTRPGSTGRRPRPALARVPTIDSDASPPKGFVSWMTHDSSIALRPAYTVPRLPCGPNGPRRG